MLGKNSFASFIKNSSINEMDREQKIHKRKEKICNENIQKKNKKNFLSKKLLNLSDFIIGYFLIQNFLSIFSIKYLMKNIDFNVTWYFCIASFFFCLNVIFILANIFVLNYHEISNIRCNKKFSVLISEIILFIRSSILNFFYIAFSKIYVLNTGKFNKNYEIKEAEIYERNLFFLKNKFYNFNFFYTNLMISLTYRVDNKISFILIFLMIIPNFISLFLIDFYTTDIIELLFFFIISLLLIYLRKIYFSTFLEENKFIEKELVQKQSEEKQEIRTLKINQKNKFNLKDFNNFSKYFYFKKNKNLIFDLNENLFLINNFKLKNKKFKENLNLINGKNKENTNFNNINDIHIELPINKKHKKIIKNEKELILQNFY